MKSECLYILELITSKLKTENKSAVGLLTHTMSYRNTRICQNRHANFGYLNVPYIVAKKKQSKIISSSRRFSAGCRPAS